MFQASDGRLWVGADGTEEIVTDAKGRIQLRMFDPKGSGFNMEDAAGNLDGQQESRADGLCQLWTRRWPKNGGCPFHL